MGQSRRRYRYGNSSDTGNRIRVRGKRLDQVDESKLTLAYWLLAKKIVEDKTDPAQLNETNVRKLAATLDENTTTTDKEPS